MADGLYYYRPVTKQDGEVSSKTRSFDVAAVYGGTPTGAAAAVQAAMFVDGSYEGDLMAAACVSYTVGREPASTYGETLGGQWQTVVWKDVLACMLHGAPPPTTLEDGLIASYTCFGMEDARETGSVANMAGYWKDL